MSIVHCKHSNICSDILLIDTVSEDSVYIMLSRKVLRNYSVLLMFFIVHHMIISKCASFNVYYVITYYNRCVIDYIDIYL